MQLHIDKERVNAYLHIRNETVLGINVQTVKKKTPPKNIISPLGESVIAFAGGEVRKFTRWLWPHSNAPFFTRKTENYGLQLGICFEYSMDFY